MSIEVAPRKSQCFLDSHRHGLPVPRLSTCTRAAGVALDRPCAARASASVLPSKCHCDPISQTRLV